MEKPKDLLVFPVVSAFIGCTVLGISAAMEDVTVALFSSVVVVISFLVICKCDHKEQPEKIPCDHKEQPEKIPKDLIVPECYTTVIPTTSTDFSMVSVDYDKSVAEMVEAGHYDWSNNNINDTNFKFNENGVVTVDLKLVCLNNTASFCDVLSYFEQNGLRPANLAELLAFGATYPEIQREFPVFCLDENSFLIDKTGGFPGIPYLSRCDKGRDLDLKWYVLFWNKNCRFLAVKK